MLHYAVSIVFYQIKDRGEYSRRLYLLYTIPGNKNRVRSKIRIMEFRDNSDDDYFLDNDYLDPVPYPPEDIPCDEECECSKIDLNDSEIFPRNIVIGDNIVEWSRGQLRKWKEFLPAVDELIAENYFHPMNRDEVNTIILVLAISYNMEQVKDVLENFVDVKTIAKIVIKFLHILCPRLWALSSINYTWFNLIAFTIHVSEKSVYWSKTVEDIIEDFRLHYESIKDDIRHRIYIYGESDQKVLGDPQEYFRNYVANVNLEIIIGHMWNEWDIETEDELENPISFAQWLPEEMVRDSLSLVKPVINPDVHFPVLHFPVLHV